MDFLVVLAVVVALAVGLTFGWLMWGRSSAEWRARHGVRDDEARALDEKFRRAIVELEGATVRAERSDALAGQLDIARAEREQLRADLAELRANAANFEEQKRLLVSAREEMMREFKVTGSEVLNKAQEKFAVEAAARMGDAEARSKEAVANLLKPVSERLLKYEEQVGSLERQRADAFSRLHQQIELMRVGQDEVRREAQRLGNSLTNAPKARGRWGEQALRNVLEQCGLAEHTDFVTEHSVNTEDGRLRPDAIVRIPGHKLLVIDSKVSLNAYQEAFEAEEGEGRKAAFQAHARSMRNHVQTLATKSYQSQFEEAPDYVVMFVPGEHFVAAALETDPELWDFAFKNRVLLATPTNLVAIARTVAQVWRQDALAREAQEIGRMGAELYDRLRVASEHLKRMGAGLEGAVNNYNKFVGSFERNVLSSGRRLADKGIEIGKKAIEEVDLIEKSPTYGLADLAVPDLAVADPADADPSEAVERG